MHAEPVALGVKHLDLDLASYAGRLAFVCSSNCLEPGALFGESCPSFIVSELLRVAADGVDVDVHSLIGFAAVVSLEEDPGSRALGVDDSRKIISILLGYSELVGKGVSGFKTLGR